MQKINEIEKLQKMIKENALAVVVFTTPSCGVCNPLKEKIGQALEEFPSVARASVDLSFVEMAKGEYQVYTAPIILLFVEGKESKRYSRALNIREFIETVKRYYELMY